jgi:hypothetical protein
VEPPGDAGPDAFGATGDQYGAAGEVRDGHGSHARLPSKR